MAKKIYKLKSPVFGLASEEYKNFRPIYPNQLFERIADCVKPYGLEHALDIGSGTGLSAEGLLNIFQKVSILDPDEKLLMHVDESKFEKIINKKIEDHQFDNDDFYNLITFGNSFYWTDGPNVLNQLAKRTFIIAAYRYDFPVIMNEANKVLKKHLDLYWEKYRHERLRTTNYTWECFKSSDVLKNVQINTIPYIIKMNVENFVGFITSTSYGSSYIRSFNNRLEVDSYVTQLIDEIKTSSKSLTIEVNFSLELVTGISTEKF